MSSQTAAQELYKQAIVIVQKRVVQLKEFLQQGKQISINNKQYMESYDIVLKASDEGANPVSQGDKETHTNIEEKLFDSFKSLIKEYLQKDLENCQDIQEPTDFASKVILQFKNYKLFLHWLWKVYQYLDRFYLKNKESSLKIQGFIFYKEFYWDKISKKVFKVVSDFQFKELREQNQIPKNVVQSLIGIFSFVGFQKTLEIAKNIDDTKFTQKFENFNDGDQFIIYSIKQECEKYYKENFEQEFSQKLEQFYIKKVQGWKNLSTPEYVTEVLKALQFEKQVAKYYYPQSEEEMIQIIERIAITENAEQITKNESTGAYFMLQNDKQDQLKDIYNLLNHSSKTRNTLNYLATKFQEYLNQHGKSYQADAEQQKQDKKAQKDIALEYIKQVLSLRTRSDQLMENVFNKDLILQAARDKAFQQFLNDNDKSTFYLAQHCDSLLKSDQFNNDAVIEEELTNIMKIFFSLYQRDSFFKHYQRFFSNRLLNSTSKNNNAEKDLIAKFKAEAGQSAVSKISTMLQDISLSNDLMDANSEQLKKIGGFSFSVNVLTVGSWPLSLPEKKEGVSIVIPSALKKTIAEFERLYLQKHNGRNLTWLFNQGQAELIFSGKDEKDKSKKKRYTLISNSNQLLMLLTLDDNQGVMTFDKLQQDTTIIPDELDYSLQACVKQKLIQREQKEGPFKLNEKITINDNFSNKSTKVKIVPSGKAEKKKQDTETINNQEKWNKEVEQERECVIDACIVRIMKGKRQSVFNQLIPETVNLITNFKAEISVIKRRIESLIDRDYLKRDPEDLQKLSYIP